MNLQDLIATIDFEAGFERWIDSETMFRAFGIDAYDYIDLSKHGFRHHLFAPWLCTDTSVGAGVLFVHNQPVALTMQSGRKSETNYKWVSKAAYDATVALCYTIIQDTRSVEIELADLTQEMGIGYPINYSGGLLSKTVILVATGQELPVVKIYRDHKEIDSWTFVDVQMPDGTTQKTSMKDVLVPYKVK